MNDQGDSAFIHPGEHSMNSSPGSPIPVQGEPTPVGTFSSSTDFQKYFRDSGFSDINIEGPYHRSALRFAVHQLNVEAVAWLFSRGVVIKQWEDSDILPQFLMDIISSCINSTDSSSQAKLRAAMAISRLFLENGADPYEICHGQSPMRRAICCGAFDMVRMILDICPLPDHINAKYGSSFASCAYFSRNREIGRLLLKAGLAAVPPPNVVPKLNWGVYLGLIEEVHQGAIENGHYARDHMGVSPLHVAAYCGDTEIFAALLVLELDIFATDSNGCTALHYAAAGGSETIAKNLIEGGLNPNDGSEQTGMRAVHEAARHGHVGIIDLLSKNNGDVFAEDVFGQDALLMAAREGQTHVVEWYLQNNFKWAISALSPALAAAISNDRQETISLIMDTVQDKGVRIEMSNQLRTAIISCRSHQAATIIAEKHFCFDRWLSQRDRQFLAVSADLPDSSQPGSSLDPVDEDNATLVHYAARANCLTALESLHYRKEPLDQQDIRGETPLSWAVKAGSTEAMVDLVSFGATPLVIDIEGCSLFYHGAIHHASYHFISCMLRSGILVTEKDILYNSSAVAAAVGPYPILYQVALSGVKSPQCLAMLLRSATNQRRNEFIRWLVTQRNAADRILRPPGLYIPGLTNSIVDLDNDMSDMSYSDPSIDSTEDYSGSITALGEESTEQRSSSAEPRLSPLSGSRAPSGLTSPRALVKNLLYGTQSENSFITQSLRLTDPTVSRHPPDIGGAMSPGNSPPAGSARFSLSRGGLSSFRLILPSLTVPIEISSRVLSRMDEPQDGFNTSDHSSNILAEAITKPPVS